VPQLRRSSAAILLILLFSPGSAFAGTLNVTFVSSGTMTMGGVYVGPYTINVSNNGVGQNITVICDDAVDLVHNGESWEATSSTIASGLAGAKWAGVTIGANVDGNSSAVTLTKVQEYEAIQYLAQLMIANLSNRTTVGEIQWAIWDLTDPGLIKQSNGSEKWGNLSKYLAGIDGYIQAGINNDGGSASQLVIYTPVPGSNPMPQEYVQVTPEPASLTLLGCGLLVIGGLLRKKLIG